MDGVYMPAPNWKAVNLTSLHNEDNEEEFSIPLDISDIINICKEYNKLGWNLQNQIENILEFGIEESIKYGYVKQESLVPIKYFLIAISNNPYFGDAGSQATDCIQIIREYESKNKKQYLSSIN